MLISLSNLTFVGTIQKNIYTKVRPIGLIDVNTKEQQIRCRLWKWSIAPGGGGTAIYGPYRYVPLWRVWFSSSLL